MTATMKHWLGAHLLMLALICVVESSSEQNTRVSFYSKPSMMSSSLLRKDHESDDDRDILLNYASAFVNNDAMVNDHLQGNDRHDDHDNGTGKFIAFSRILTNSEGSKPWGAALLAAFLVNLCTLIGILTLIPASLLSRMFSRGQLDILRHILIPSFACGALAATSVFLLIPESIHLLSGGGGDAHENSESDVAWKFGVSVLGGYFIPFVFSGLFPHCPSTDDHDMVQVNKEDDTTTPVAPVGNTIDEDNMEKGHDGKSKANDELSAETVQLDVSTKVTPDYRLMTSILVGDFFHNFSDGIFIGTSFLVCSQSFAIAVSLSTVFHELSHQLVNYLMLTNQCRLSPWKALVLNFVSGFSVMIGVIVIMAMDVSNEAIGVLLAMSAGVYFNIAFTDCAPRINHHITDTLRRVTSLFFWIIGAVPIGLVLLNHEHCE
ncbi:ZIP Zinc transporter [Fragilaria crotonensis]|nr:ZIP Zinc transporter [Fragilaria crotonensis]